MTRASICITAFSSVSGICFAAVRILRLNNPSIEPFIDHAARFFSHSLRRSYATTWLPVQPVMSGATFSGLATTASSSPSTESASANLSSHAFGISSLRDFLVSIISKMLDRSSRNFAAESPAGALAGCANISSCAAASGFTLASIPATSSAVFPPSLPISACR